MCRFCIGWFCGPIILENGKMSFFSRANFAFRASLSVSCRIDSSFLHIMSWSVLHLVAVRDSAIDSYAFFKKCQGFCGDIFTWMCTCLITRKLTYTACVCMYMNACVSTNIHTYICTHVCVNDSTDWYRSIYPQTQTYWNKVTISWRCSNLMWDVTIVTIFTRPVAKDGITPSCLLIVLALARLKYVCDVCVCVCV